MDVKTAVQIAKSWLTEMLGDEQIFNVGLEEVEYDDMQNAWRITMGFSRPWNTQRNALTSLTGEPASRRAYRVITVRDLDGAVQSMKKRDSDAL